MHACVCARGGCVCPWSVRAAPSFAGGFPSTQSRVRVARPVFSGVGCGGLGSAQPGAAAAPLSAAVRAPCGQGFQFQTQES